MSIQKHIYTNCFFNRSRFSDLFATLFRPSLILEKAILKNEEAIGTKYVAATFRFQQLLGDFKEGAGFQVLEPAEQTALINKCYTELLEKMKNIESSFRILVTSDSISFLEHVKKDPRIYVIPGVVHHTHFRIENEDYPFLKSFVDFYMLMGAKFIFLFKTGAMYDSGFPKLAALCSGKTCIMHEF